MPYVVIARPLHWAKNIFFIVGLLLAFRILQQGHPILDFKIGLAFLSLCLAASTNYVCNEWLDRVSDGYHPQKNKRPCVRRSANPFYIWLEYLILMNASLILAFVISLSYFLLIFLFLLLGVAYNCPPLRLKDFFLVDVLVESLLIPLRVTLGWIVISPESIPPITLLLGFWFVACALSSLKRYRENVVFTNPSEAGLYRKSFLFYSPKILKGNTTLFAILSLIMVGLFIC